jgi:hypothetical protein
MRDDVLRASWAVTDADLRWVLSHARIDQECADLVVEYLDHNELGEAYDLLAHCIGEMSAELRDRMVSAAGRMGLPPPGDIPGH